MNDYKLLIIGMIVGFITFLINILINNWIQIKVLIINKKDMYYIKLSDLSNYEQNNIKNILLNLSCPDYKDTSIKIKTSKVVNKILKQYKLNKQNIFKCSFKKDDDNIIKCIIGIKNINKTMAHLEILDNIDYSEFRKHERYVVNEKSYIKIEEDYIKITIENISEGGMRVLSNHKFELNDKGIVFFDKIQIKVKIAWRSSQHINSYGLEILSIKERHDDFYKFIQNLKEKNTKIKEDESDLLIKL
jgi:hypothetical protein